MNNQETLSSNTRFTSLLEHFKKSDDSVSLLYDDNGLTRAKGFIKRIDAEAMEPFIVLNDDTKVMMKTIVGVNGVFKDDYTEC